MVLGLQCLGRGGTAEHATAQVVLFSSYAALVNLEIMR